MSETLTRTELAGTLDELEPKLRAMGFVAVRTMAGPINLSTFDPPDTLRLGGYDGRYGGILANGARYQVEIDPRANAVKIEETPIPQPKVRAGIETRYRNGQWEKYLKSAGWVRA